MKYLGGKQRLGKHISPVLKNILSKHKKKYKLDGYLEPFCGSLGVFKHMTLLEDIETIVANDYHPDLIQLFKDVQSNKFKYPKLITEKQHKDAKKIKSPSALKAFIGFGMSFGGRYFGVYSQKYLGTKKEDFCKEMVNSLKRLAPLIQKKNVKFTNTKYQKLNPKNKLIYCDPPYENTRFPIKYRRDTKYYDTFDNNEFWEIMRKWSKNNIVIISELSAPPDFKTIWTMKKYRSAAQSKKTRFKNKNNKNDKNRTKKNIYKTEKLFVHESINL